MPHYWHSVTNNHFWASYRVVDGVQARYTEEFLQLVEAKDYVECKKILEDDSSKVEVRDEETQFTPLHVAAKNGQNEIVGLLLEHKADCNVQDINKTTPLHLAAAKDHLFCCQTLLQQPDIEVRYLVLYMICQS